MPLNGDNDSESGGITLDKAFRKAGGLGQFHTLMFLTLASFLTTGEIYNSLIMYFNRVPNLLCTMSSGQTVSCDWETACESNDS